MKSIKKNNGNAINVLVLLPLRLDVGGPGVAPGTEMGTRNSLLLAITLVSLGPPVVRIARILGRATLPHSHSLHGRQV